MRAWALILFAALMLPGVLHAGESVSVTEAYLQQLDDTLALLGQESRATEAALPEVEYLRAQAAEPARLQAWPPPTERLASTAGSGAATSYPKSSFALKRNNTAHGCSPVTSASSPLRSAATHSTNCHYHSIRNGYIRKKGTANNKPSRPLPTYPSHPVLTYNISPSEPGHALQPLSP